MRQLLKNKKGSEGDAYVASEKIFKYIVLIVLFAGTLITFLAFGSEFMDSLAHVDTNLEAELMIKRMQNVCFAVEDEHTGLLRENVIDHKSFNRTTLEDCFTSETTPGMVLSLQPLEYSVEHETDFPTKFMKTGTGENIKNYDNYVLVKYDGEIYPGELHVKI